MENLGICANCGTDIDWSVTEKKKKAYRLDNDDVVCSKKCLKEYAISYFNDYTEIIRR